MGGAFFVSDVSVAPGRCQRSIEEDSMSENRKLVREAVLRDLDAHKSIEGDARFSHVDNSRGIPPEMQAGADTLIALSFGSRPDLTMHGVQEAVRMWREVRPRCPDSLININLLGYDDGPREISNIPEAARFFRRWAKLVRMRTPEQAEAQKLDPISIGPLAACGAFARELRDWARAQLPPTPPQQ
jgi:hypothetical protein